jgi:hypothetical protein
MPAEHREVVFEAHFEQSLARLSLDPHHADDIIDGAVWVLSREPYAGTQLGPSSLVWFLSVDLPTDDPIGIYYTFDDSTVYLLSGRVPLDVEIGQRFRFPWALARANAC